MGRYSAADPLQHLDPPMRDLTETLCAEACELQLDKV